MQQLATPGRMVVPVWNKHSQVLVQVDKNQSGTVTQRELFQVVVRTLFLRRGACAAVRRKSLNHWRDSSTKDTTHLLTGAKFLGSRGGGGHD
jgi:Protein-L-isoaspartate(D-aspartate) O-methyltransferase (PCMT)